MEVKIIGHSNRGCVMSAAGTSANCLVSPPTNWVVATTPLPVSISGSKAANGLKMPTRTAAPGTGP